MLHSSQLEVQPLATVLAKRKRSSKSSTSKDIEKVLETPPAKRATRKSIKTIADEDEKESDKDIPGYLMAIQKIVDAGEELKKIPTLIARVREAGFGDMIDSKIT